MKKGQVVLLVVLVIITIVLFSLMFYLSSRPPTGLVVFEDVTEENPLEGIDDKCSIDSAFQCKVWKMDIEENEMFLQLSNSLREGLVIREVFISGCESEDFNVYLDGGSGRTMTFSCPLVEGEVFVGDISIFYRSAKGGLLQETKGLIIQNIV